MTHYEHLMGYIPDLPRRRILDLGSGRGSFLIDVVKRGGNIWGLERSQGYIEIATAEAKKSRVEIKVRLGMAENIPFENQSFDFVNVCEVIEHVEDPDKTLSEMHRVLTDNGKAYVSVPNRYCLRDPHFHLYFVNWLPRVFCNAFISLFKRHKNYIGDIGKQRLDEMYYATYKNAKTKAQSHGFKAEDMRLIKISKKFPNSLVQFIVKVFYVPARFLYFDSCHLLLTKQSKK
jgi:ubiquinone/menaquinone biosynthesis C-methylase UbiE